MNQKKLNKYLIELSFGVLFGLSILFMLKHCSF